jgi:TRAP-type C4-dicarboxylate transport system permease small subunit
MSMAKSEIAISKVIALVLIVAGAGVIYWGYDLSGSVSSQISETLSGSTPDGVVTRYIAGAAALVAGLFIFFKS